MMMQDGWNALMRASLNGHFSIVTTLIEAGANVNQTNKVVDANMYCSFITCLTMKEKSPQVVNH